MKNLKSQRPPVDTSSQDAVKYRAAREVIAKVEDRLAEDEENERIEKPGRMVVRVLAGILLVLWTIVMTWIAVKSLKKKGGQAQLDGPAIIKIKSA